MLDMVARSRRLQSLVLDAAREVLESLAANDGGDKDLESTVKHVCLFHFGLSLVRHQGTAHGRVWSVKCGITLPGRQFSHSCAFLHAMQR